MLYYIILCTKAARAGKGGATPVPRGKSAKGKSARRSRAN